MADSTKLPTLAEMFIGQWARKDEPSPKLDAPIDDDDDTLQFSVAIKDEDGTVPTAGVPIGIRKSNGWVEQCWIPANGLSVDGKTATGVIRGVGPAGLDYTTGSSDFADAHEQGESVFINIPAFFGEMLRSALQGVIATGSNSFIIGTDADGTVTIKRSGGVGTSLGFLRWSTTNDKAEYSNNGTDWTAFDDNVASVLAKVSSNDTTPGYFSTKLSAGDNIELNITSPSGDERLEISAHGNLEDIVDNVTSTAAELDQAVSDVQGLSQGLLPVGFYPGGGEVTYGTLGDEITADDITNNRNLVYQLPSDMKWYKVTSTASTWYYKLGLVTEDGAADSSKRILLRGRYENQSFSNINPTFSSALTGTTLNVGQTDSTCAQAFLVDNSTGAECVVTGGTISAKQAGTPSGEMRIYLVLNSYTDQSTKPACFFDSTNFVIRGAIIGSATIAQANFSGVFQDLAFSFGANVKIPAKTKAYLVMVKAGAVNATNYYQIQSNAATSVYNYTNQTWSNSPNAGNYTLTVTSTSPVGYSVKAYVSSDGDYGIVSSNAWSKVIGQVLDATTIYFDPSANRTSEHLNGWNFSATGASGFLRVTTPFAPSEVKTILGLTINATTDESYHLIGHTRGDNTLATVFGSESKSGGVNSFPYSFGGLNLSLGTPAVMGLGMRNVTTGYSQNKLHIVRLEDGFYAYNGYPATTALYLSGGVGGWTDSIFVFNFIARQ